VRKQLAGEDKKLASGLKKAFAAPPQPVTPARVIKQTYVKLP